MADPVEDTAGRLYGLPLEEFTRERDAAARELRRAKEREAADTVKQLPKPSQAAWAANALARERRELVDALLEAGDDLRAAQEDAVAGRGAAALRDAATAERAAVDALVAAAKELRPGGRKPTGTTLDRLRTTLHAAASDDDVRTALDRGRVVEDAAGGSAWGLLAGGEAPAPAPKPKPKPKPAKPSRAKRGDETAAERKTREREEREAAKREAREAAEREAAARGRLEAELREARTERRSRERELDRAERAADRAAGRLEAALAAAEEAREQADEANAELEGAREAAGSARDDVARLEEQLD